MSKQKVQPLRLPQKRLRNKSLQGSKELAAFINDCVWLVQMSHAELRHIPVFLNVSLYSMCQYGKVITIRQTETMTMTLKMFAAAVVLAI